MLGTSSLPGDATRRSRWSRLFALARASAVAVVVLLACVASLARSAEARAGEALLGFGRELAAWTDAHRQSAPRVLSLNGLQLELMTLTTPLDVKRSLDHFEERCRKSGGLRAPVAHAQQALAGVLRREAEHEGVLACIDTDGPLEVAALSERLDRFTKSGNLGDLGKLRYVVARRSGATTTLLVLWTDANAQLLGLIPATGDAPGRDPSDFPRHRALRRVLSAAEQGAPYTLAVYEAGSQSASGLATWYAAELERTGWTVSRTGDQLRAHLGARSILLVAKALRGGKTALSIAELS